MIKFFITPVNISLKMKSILIIVFYSFCLHLVSRCSSYTWFYFMLYILESMAGTCHKVRKLNNKQPPPLTALECEHSMHCTDLTSCPKGANMTISCFFFKWVSQFSVGHPIKHRIKRPQRKSKTCGIATIDFFYMSRLKRKLRTQTQR